jgi:hypothetical protein
MLRIDNQHGKHLVHVGCASNVQTLVMNPAPWTLFATLSPVGTLIMSDSPSLSQWNALHAELHTAL